MSDRIFNDLSARMPKKRGRLLVLVLLFAIAGSARAVDINWTKAREPYRGIKILAFQLEKPRLMRVALMRIDLKTPRLRLVTTGRDPNWSKPMPDYPALPIATRRITTAEFMRRANARTTGKNVVMVAAFNAAPWRPWEKPYTHRYGNPLGLNISNGETVSDGNPELPALVVWKNGAVEILDHVDREKSDLIREAVSGFCMIARHGKLLPDAGYSKGLMPRMAYGLSRDRRHLYVMAIDGRQDDWSLGATGSEAGRLLLAAGAYDVINMDGGGSATLCYWDRKKKQPQTMNRQSKDGYLRPVASNVGVVLYR